MVQANLLGDWSVVIEIRPWVLIEHYVGTTAEINSAVLGLFRSRDIPMAVPQREVWLVTGPG